MKNFSKKVPQYFIGGDTMSLLHWKVMWECMLPQYLQEKGLKLVNILNLAKRIVWQIKSVG